MRHKPVIPVILPFKRLNEKKFKHLLRRAYYALDTFNLFCAKHPFLMRERGIQREKKASSHLPSKAIRFALQNKRLTLSYLCRLHRLCVGARVEEGVRTTQNWIGPHRSSEEGAYFYPPAPIHLTKGLKNWIRYFRSAKEDPLIQLAIFFAQFLILHPFMDGNGRMARLLIPQFLYQKQVTLTPSFFMGLYFKRNRLDYFHKLYLISKTGKWDGWISFFLRGIIECLPKETF